MQLANLCYYLYTLLLILRFSMQLVDFECWKSIQVRSEKNLRNISCEGAICVLPNAMEHRDLDLQGNVYSFGILLLEIISGRPSYCQERGCLVEWVRIAFSISLKLSDYNKSLSFSCLSVFTRLKAKKNPSRIVALPFLPIFKTGESFRLCFNSNQMGTM